MAEKAKKVDAPKETKSKTQPKTQEKTLAPHLQKKPNKSKWNLQKVMNRARHYESVQEWEKGNPSSYKAAAHWGWLGECSAHMKTPAPVTNLVEHKKKKAAPKKKTAKKRTTKTTRKKTA